MAAPTLSLAAETAPRYTSYPTAPHFHAGIAGSEAAQWQAAVGRHDAVSLYLHVPYCDRLCWFCACHTRHTLRYEPVADFVQALLLEIELTAARLVNRPPVGAIHFGGGSPTMLRPADFMAIMRVLRKAFAVVPDAAVSVEIDPNDVDEAKLDGLAAGGMTRASLGIQDFEPKVQAAINRLQSFEETRRVVEGLRRRGIAAVNLDLVYGLPHQTTESLSQTVDRCIEMRPDRLALFGYAHVPWFKKHQTMIDEAALPGPEARLALQERAASMIRAAGYDTIGIDHFSLPGDGLSQAAKAGRLRRNFQGYTDDPCEVLVGLGPSSVSRYRQGYTQNMPAMGDYRRAVEAGRPAVARGVAFSDDDRLRAWVIERLMCDFGFDGAQAMRRFGGAAADIIAEGRVIAAREPDLLACDGQRFTVPASARQRLRVVASRFDAYLERGEARHSLAV